MNTTEPQTKPLIGQSHSNVRLGRGLGIKRGRWANNTESSKKTAHWYFDVKNNHSISYCTQTSFTSDLVRATENMLLCKVCVKGVMPNVI